MSGTRRYAAKTALTILVAPVACIVVMVGYSFGFSYPHLISAKVRYSGTVHRLDPVFAALEAYRRDRGGYPGCLSNLVPRYLPALPELPSRFRGRYDGDVSSPSYGVLGGHGYAYGRCDGSYAITTFVSRPCDHPGGWLAGWTETLTYYGPGAKRPSTNVVSAGHVGKWEYVGFLD